MTNPKPNFDNKRGSIEGVIAIEGQGQLPQEFITIGNSFDEALGRCVLRDDDQKNAVIIYKAQLELFEMNDEIDHLTAWLNASAAVGGINRKQAGMTYTGIWVPDDLNKNAAKQLKEYNEYRANMRQDEKEKDAVNH